jgi:dihydrofolate reductase
MKATAPHDITISGPTLAAEAFKSNLADVCHFFIAPILVGDGTSAFPRGLRLQLTILDERRFNNGMVYLHYRSAAGEGGRRGERTNAASRDRGRRRAR